VKYLAAGAEIDGEYRYRLWRVWDENLPTALFVMLNPSTADGSEDDPTIRRCVGFAKAWGCGRLDVVNLYAYRATDPDTLRTAINPIGRMNDHHVREAAYHADPIVLAWGAGPFRDPERREEVMLALRRSGKRLHVLGYTKRGEPKHPLYLKGDLKPVPWERQVGT